MAFYFKNKKGSDKLFINTNFMFDDIDCSEFGIIVVKTNSGMIEMPFGTRRSIIEEKRQFNPVPFFYGVDEEPLTIKITIAKENDGKWNYQERRNIIKWLFQKEYKPLISYDNPDIAYYVIVQGDSTRLDNSLEQGYATIELRANAPWGYSYPKSLLNYSRNMLLNNDTIVIDNRSNIQKFYYPEVQFEILSGTSFSIQNLSLQGEIFEFKNLQPNEIIYVDNNRKFIISNLEKQGVFRRENFNGKWLRLIQGRNRLKVTGDVNLELRLQFPVAL